MGDKERCAEVEEEKEMRMIRLSPPGYPLPEEIKKMERSETVCRYCGVSYLIYHEFHQLSTRLAELETELQELRASAQRNEAQCEALELGRREWERALELEARRKAEEKEFTVREEMEKRNRDAERALREAFERKAREMHDEHQKISGMKEEELRRELGDLEEERLTSQREELERRSEEREKSLRDALQKARKESDDLRESLQRVDQRLAVATSAKEEAEQLLRAEKQQGEKVRGVCVQQVKALRATLSTLRSCGAELAELRGFLRLLTGAWQAFKSQILQHSTQALSVLKEELEHSSQELQKMREERENLTQQLMEQRKQGEEQQSKQEASEEEHRGTLLRLQVELEEKHQKWLSSQQRRNSLRERLLSWQQRAEQTTWKYKAAEEEVAGLRGVLESVQQEVRELRKDRDVLIDNHGRALRKMEEDCRQQSASKLATCLEEQRTQNALHLEEQMEAFRKEVELDLSIDREKNQLLLLQYQQDSAQLQQQLKHRDREVGRLTEELQQARRSREEIHQELQRSQQQGALHLSRARTELQLMNERNAELQEEVMLLQETVRKECQEREELTAALSKAQEEILELRSPAVPHTSPRSPPNPPERHTPPAANRHFHPSSQVRVPLTRSATPPNKLPPPLSDPNTGRWSDGGGAGRSVESRKGTLPRLKASSTVSEVKRKVSLMMGKVESSHV